MRGMHAGPADCVHARVNRVRNSLKTCPAAPAPQINSQNHQDRALPRARYTSRHRTYVHHE